MNEKLYAELKEYAAKFVKKGFIDSGYIAVREEDGILITAPDADLSALKEDKVVFINDKNIESVDGNFRAAAVILFCAIRQDKTAMAAAIVDSSAILEFSSKRRTLMPVLVDLAKLLGTSVKDASKNVAAEIVTSLSGMRNACFMPDAGAVVKARSLSEVFECVEILDKAANADLLSEKKGGTKHLNSFEALLTHITYKMKTAKNFEVKAEKEIAHAPAAAPANNDAETANNAPEANGNSDKAEEAANAQNNAEKADNATEKTDKAENEAAAENAENNAENAENNGEKTENNAETSPENADENAENNADKNTDKNADDSENCDLNAEKFELKEGCYALFARPYYASAVCALAAPMPVPDEFKEELGDELPCIDKVNPKSKKAAEKILEAIGDAPACFIALNGVVVRGANEKETLETLKKVEAASKAYFE